MVSSNQKKKNFKYYLRNWPLNSRMAFEILDLLDLSQYLEEVFTHAPMASTALFTAAEKGKPINVQMD